jgi:hypothetical protein
MPPPALEKKLSLPIIAPDPQVTSSPKQPQPLFSAKSLASLKASRPDAVADANASRDSNITSPPASRPQLPDEREETPGSGPAAASASPTRTRSPGMRSVNPVGVVSPTEGIYSVPYNAQSMRQDKQASPQGRGRKVPPNVPPLKTGGSVSVHELVESPILPSPDISPRNGAVGKSQHRSAPQVAASTPPLSAAPAPIPAPPPVTFAVELAGADFIPFASMQAWQRQQVEVNVLRDEIFASLKGKIENRDLVSAQFVTPLSGGMINVEGTVACGTSTAERRAVIRRLADFVNSPGVFDRSLGAVYVLCGGSAGSFDPAVRRIQVHEAFINDVPVKLPAPPAAPAAPAPEAAPNPIVSPQRDDFVATQEGTVSGVSAAHRSTSDESRDGRSAYEARLRQGGICTPHEGIFDRQSPMNNAYSQANGRSLSVQSALSSSAPLQITGAPPYREIFTTGGQSRPVYSDPTLHMPSVQHSEGTVYRTRRYLTQT